VTDLVITGAVGPDTQINCIEHPFFGSANDSNLDDHQRTQKKNIITTIKFNKINNFIKRQGATVFPLDPPMRRL
jgi:hypothetical protein